MFFWFFFCLIFLNEKMNSSEERALFLKSEWINRPPNWNVWKYSFTSCHNATRIPRPPIWNFTIWLAIGQISLPCHILGQSNPSLLFVIEGKERCEKLWWYLEWKQKKYLSSRASPIVLIKTWICSHHSSRDLGLNSVNRLTNIKMGRRKKVAAKPAAPAASAPAPKLETPAPKTRGRGLTLYFK